MKQIPIVNSEKVALVDDEDFDFLNQYRWWLHNDGYAACSACNYQYMHLAVWFKRKGQFTVGLLLDHINNDKLNNQISNLREVSKRGNALNCRRSSLHPNIRVTPKGNWQVRLNVNKKEVVVGTFPTLDKAILERDNFLQKLGETVEDAETNNQLAIEKPSLNSCK